jgi:hypothetical protein
MEKWVSRKLKDHSIVRLFQSFVDSNKDNILRELIQLMDVTDNRNARWILFQLGVDLAKPTNLPPTAASKEPHSLITTFDDAKKTR